MKPALFSVVFWLLGFLSLSAQSLSLPSECGERGMVLGIKRNQQGETAALLRSWDQRYLAVKWNASGSPDLIGELNGDFHGLFFREGSPCAVTFDSDDVLRGLVLFDLERSSEIQRLPLSELLQQGQKDGRELSRSEAVFMLSGEGNFLAVEYWLGEEPLRWEGREFDSEFCIIDLSDNRVIFRHRFLSTRDHFVARGRFSPRISVSFSPDETKAVISGTEFSTAVVDLKTGERGEALINPQGDPCYLFLADGRILQYDHYSRKCRLFLPEGGLPTQTFIHGFRYPAVVDNRILSFFDDGYQVFVLDKENLSGESFLFFPSVIRGARYFEAGTPGVLFSRIYADNELEYREISLPEGRL